MKRIGKNLLVLGLILAGIVGITACKKDEPPVEEEKTLNVLSGFAGHADYTISQNTVTALEFDYAKGEDATVSISKAVEGLKEYKKLLITVTGDGEFSLILENAAGTTVKKVSIYATSFSVDYEWDLRNDSTFLDSVRKIRIIAAPGKTGEEGNIRITKLMFSDQLADNYVINTDFSNIPSNINEYDGVADEFHFNQKWVNNEPNGNEDPIYTFAYANNETTVTYDKSGGFGWAFFYNLVKGDFSKFNYIVLKVQGTAGVKVLAKFEPNNIEDDIILNGEVQEFAIDFSALTDAEKKLINRILVFGAAGTDGAKGSFKILDAYMTDEYTVVNPKIYNTYNGTDETFQLHDWMDNGDGIYEVEKVGTDEVITYQKGETGHDWSTVAAYIKDSDLSGFERIVFEITGEAEKTALLKFEAEGKNVELPVTFTGEKQTFVIDLSDFTSAQLKAPKQVLIFGDQSKSANASGKITVHRVYFDVNPPVELFDINDGYVSNDAGVYTFTSGETGVTVAYTKVAGQEWSYFYRDVIALEAEGFNTLVMRFKGTAGDTVMVKPNNDGSLEQQITLDENGEGVYEKLIPGTLTKVIVFVKPNALGTGTLTIIESGLKFVEPPFVLPDPLVHPVVMGELMDSGDGVYTFTQNEGFITVNYVKAAGQEWATMRVDLVTYEALKNYNYYKVNLRGTPEKQVLVKVNGQEIWVTFDSEGLGSAEFRKESFTEILFFAEGGVDTVTGSFDILGISLEYHYDFSVHAENPSDGYALSFNEAGQLVVTYTNVSGYKAQIISFPAEVYGFNRFNIRLQTEPGVKVLFKPNDAQPLELILTADESGIIEYIFDITETKSMIFFVNPDGDTALSGTVTFLVSELVYYEAPIIPEPLFDINNSYVSKDENVYTFTDVTEGVKVDFTKDSGKEWAFFYRDVTTLEAEGFNTLVMRFKGTAGDEILVKPNDNGAYETSITLDSNGEGVYEKFIAEPLTKVIVFVKPNALGTGTLTIIESGLKFVEPPFVLPDPLVHPVVMGELMDSGDGVYTFTQNEGFITVNYVKAAGQEWATMRVDLVTYEALKNYNYYKVNLRGTPEKQVLVKVNGQEIWVTFDSEGLGSAEFRKESFTEILFFAEGGVDTVTGSFDILGISLEYHYDFSVHAENPSDGYALSFNEAGQLVVTYTNVSGYKAQIISFPAEVYGFNRFNIRLQTEPGVKVLFKPNDAQPLELILTADESGIIEYIFDITETKSMIFFVNPDGDTALSGTVTFLVSELVYYEAPIIPEPLFDINNSYVSKDENVYTFTDVTEGVKVDFTKDSGKEWAFFYRDVTTLEAEGFNTLVMRFKGTAGDEILVKPNDNGAYETSITLDSNGEGVYEKFIAEPLTKVIVFVKPNALGTGTLTIIESGLKFVEQPVIIPVDVLSHEVVLAELIDSGDNVYTFTQADGFITVNYVKGAGQEWSTMRVDLVTYAGLKDYNYIKVNLRGTPEKQVLVKVNGQEIWVTFDGAGLGSAEFRKESFTEILFFAEGGVDTVTGSFDILGISLEYHYDFSVHAENPSDGYALSFNEAGQLVVTYTNVSGYKAQIISFPAEVYGFNRFNIRLQTEPGVKVLFKPNDAQPLELILTADESGIIEYIFDITETKSMIFFVNPDGDTALSGTVTFLVSELVYYEAPIIPEPLFDINNSYVSKDENVYTFTDVTEGVKVDFTKDSGKEWAFFYRDVTTLEAEGFNTLVMRFKGTAGDEILVKPNDNGAYETSITLDSNGEGVYEKFIAEPLTKVIVFVKPNALGTGTLTIIESGLKFVEQPVIIPVDVLSHEVVLAELIDSGDNVYTFTQADGFITVNYVKGAGQEWSTMRVDLVTYAGLKDYNYIKVNLRGTPEKQVLVKVNGQEIWVTFDGAGLGSAEFRKESFTEILFFAEGGVDTVTGSFDILGISLEYHYDFSVHAENPSDGYALSFNEAGQLVVTFTNVSGWMAQTISFPEDLKGFNVFDIQIETAPGVKVMFKVNNVKANEVTLTADAEGMINFVEDYPEAVSLVFFVNPGGDTAVSGKLIFTKSILRYVEPEFVPNDPIDLNNNFVGDDSGVYTITTDETGVKIDVSKVADQGYAHFYRNVTEAESAGRNTLKVTFKGTAGTSVIVKPNDSAALELTITFDSNGDGVYEKLIPGSLTKIVFMALPGQSGTAETPLTASFHIIETEFSYVE